MTQFKIGINAKMDMLKFKNLGQEREKEINITKIENINTYQVNKLASVLHPAKIKVKVARIKKETEDVKSFYLQPINQEKMPPFLPGMYITLIIKKDGRTYKRAYSISGSDPNRSYYRITIKKVTNGMVSNYMFEECLENDSFTILGPFGQFTYQPLRDSKKMVFIAGGSGITPFMSYLQNDHFIKSIESLTLFYGAKSEFDLIFKKEIDEIAVNNPKIKVIYVLSEQKRDGYAYGFIDEEKLLSENLEGKSIFVSGPTAMYFSLNEIFKKLDVPNKFVRHDIFKEVPKNLQNETFTLTIKMLDKTITIPCHGNETLIKSMEVGRVKTLIHCTVGECGFCRSKLLSGEVITENSKVRTKDQEKKYIHPCVTYPLSDVTIEVPIK